MKSAGEVNNALSGSVGGLGGIVVSGAYEIAEGSLRDGQFIQCVNALDDSTITSVTGNLTIPVNGVDLKAGNALFGKLTSIEIASGVVAIYYGEEV